MLCFRGTVCKSIFLETEAFFWGVPQSTRAAIIKYYKLDGLNNKHLFLPGLEAEKPKFLVLEDLVSRRSLFRVCRKLRGKEKSDLFLF